MRFVNGKVYTQDTKHAVADAIFCRDGRIAAVGAARDLPREGDDFDLRGRIVLPGLIDAHAHLRNLAEARRSVNVGGLRSPQEAASCATRPATPPGC